MNVSMYTYCIAHSKNARRFGGEISSQRERALDSDFFARNSVRKKGKEFAPNPLFPKKHPCGSADYDCRHSSVYIARSRSGNEQRESRHTSQKIRLARQKDVQIAPGSACMLACNSFGPRPFTLNDCIKEVAMLLLRGAQ